MSPTRNFSGTCSRKRAAAVSAASSRVGSTSVARIEPETSSRAPRMPGCAAPSDQLGRAVASEERPERGQKQDGGNPAAPARDSATTFASRSTFVERIEYRSAAGRGRETRARALGRGGAPRGAGGKEVIASLEPSEEPGEHAKPVTLGRKDDVVHAGRAEELGKLGALGRGPLGEALAQLPALRVGAGQGRPVSGSTSHSRPTSTSSCSRGSRISTAMTPHRAPSLASSARKSRRGSGSRRRGRRARAALRQSADARERLRGGRSRRAPSSSGFLAERGQ